MMEYTLLDHHVSAQHDLGYLQLDMNGSAVSRRCWCLKAGPRFGGPREAKSDTRILRMYYSVKSRCCNVS